MIQINKDKLDFSNISKPLKHLSTTDIVMLMENYYEGHTVKNLKQKYNIDIADSMFITTFPKEITDIECEYCDVNFIRKFPSRHGIHNKEPYCPICNHEHTKICLCGNCKALEKERFEKEQARKKNLIFAHYDESIFEKVPEEELTLKDKLYLSVLVRGAIDENLDNIIPIHSCDKKLTPTDDLLIDILIHLANNSRIKPHENSPISAFKDDEDFPNTYYIQKVIYRINIQPMDNNYKNMIKRLMYPSQSEFEDDKDICYFIWKEIALHESLEYLMYSMKKVGFKIKKGEKTLKVLEHLLDYFSVSQIYSIIYKQVANATKLYQERNMYLDHASNIVISSCESFGERAIAEGWNLTKYRRDYNLPQSLLSEIFFTSILKIGLLGFEEKPTSDF